MKFLKSRCNTNRKGWNMRMPDFFTVLRTKLIRKFNLIISLSFSDYYSCSIMWILEQCLECGSSLFDQFKECNIPRVLLGMREQCQKGGIEHLYPLCTFFFK